MNKLRNSSFTFNTEQEYLENSKKITYFKEDPIIFKFEEKFKNLLDDFTTSNISSLVDLNTLENLRVVSMDVSFKDLKKKIPELQYYRRSAGDGNCFHRAFIFQFFERLILISNKDNISFIKYYYNKIFDLKLETKQNFINLFRINHNIHILSAKRITLAIFKIIIDLIEKNENKIAYNLFFINFAFNKIFDNYIICWLRTLCYNTIKQKQYEELIEGLTLETISGFTGDLFKNYISNNFLTFGEEGETLIIYISAFLFKVKLNTISAHKSLSINPYGWDNIIFPDKDDYYDILPSFEFYLFHRHNHYDILISNHFYKDYIDIISPFSIYQANYLSYLKTFNLVNYTRDDINNICYNCKIGNLEVIPVSCISDEYLCVNCFYIYFLSEINTSFCGLKDYIPNNEINKMKNCKCYPVFVYNINGKENIIFPKCYNCNKYNKCYDIDSILNKIPKLNRKFSNNMRLTKKKNCCFTNEKNKNYLIKYCQYINKQSSKKLTMDIIKKGSDDNIRKNYFENNEVLLNLKMSKSDFRMSNNNLGLSNDTIIIEDKTNAESELELRKAFLKLDNLSLKCFYCKNDYIQFYTCQHSFFCNKCDANEKFILSLLNKSNNKCSSCNSHYIKENLQLLINNLNKNSYLKNLIIEENKIKLYNSFLEFNNSNIIDNFICEKCTNKLFLCNCKNTCLICKIPMKLNLNNNYNCELCEIEYYETCDIFDSKHKCNKKPNKFEQHEYFCVECLKIHQFKEIDLINKKVQRH